MHKRTAAMRLPRWVQRLLAILLALTILTGGTVYLPRLAPARYHCLRFDATNEQTLMPSIIDVDTGSFTRDQRSMLAFQHSTVFSISPNRQYQVRYVTSLQGKFKLFLEKIGGEGGILEADPTGFQNAIAWHPQSLWLSYIMWDSSTPQLVMVQPDGSGKRTVPLAKPNANLTITPLGVSNDGAYYAFYTNDGQQRAYHFLRLSDLTEQKVVSTDTSSLRFEWSLQGHWLAVIDPQRGNLQILSPEDGIVQSFDFLASTEITRLRWSPDGRYVALLLVGNNIVGVSGTLNIYGRDGQQFMQVSRWQTSTLGQLSEIIYWRSDSQSIVFVEPMADSVARYRVKQFFPEQQQTETILQDASLMGRSFALKESDAFILSYRREEQNNLALLWSGAATPVPVLSKANSIDNFAASPDDSKMAVAWIAGEGRAAEHWITLLDIRSNMVSKPAELEGEVHHFVWSADERWLAYVMQGKVGMAVELVDTVTGQKQRMGDKMETVNGLTVDSTSNRLSFVWQDAEGKSRVDVYALDGSQLTRYPVKGTEPRFGYVISPDGRSMAMLMSDEQATHYRIEIGAADGSWRKDIFQGSVNMDRLYWSPDSRSLAFAYTLQPQNNQQSPLYGIEVFSAVGDRLWQNSESDARFTNLTWTPCY